MKSLFKKCQEIWKSLHLSLTEKRVVIYITTWLLIFSWGVLVFHHMYGVYPTGTENHNQIERFVRSCASSFDLFLFNIDSNGVDGWLEHESSTSAWGWLLAIAAILAGAWTISIFVLLLGSLLRRWRKKHAALKKKETDLYIFIGINNRSKSLASEIMSEKESNAVCLFIVPPTEVQEAEKTIWDRITNVVQHKHHMYNDLGDIDAQVLIAENMITDCKKASNFWRELGSPSIDTYITNSKKIYVLLLGEDETKNINDALVLSNPALWYEHIENLTILCHARRNNANRVIEDVTSSNVIEMVDSSHLAIELLKKDPRNHPVRFVDIQNGVVSSSFNSLIVGFSECGQDALRFLYEFSAFVDAKSKEQEDIRSPFKCYVVDKQLSPSAARWMHHAKGMFDQRNNDGSKCITFNPKMDYNSSEFYSEVLDKIIDDLNYVVIAVGDDQAGITLAVDILRYALKIGRLKNQTVDDCSKDNFRIYVRSYDPNMYDYLKTIASHYNEEAEYITIFGAEQELYTKQMLIDESLLESAKAYQLHYEEAYRIHHDHNNDKMSEQECKQLWSNRRKKLFAQTPKLQGTLDLRRKESQDYANALHIETKKCLKLYDASALILAKTEHLRWIAAHEIMGYSYDKKTDILHYKHCCMIPWKKLKGDTREYDFLTFNELFSQECLSTAISKAKKDAYDYKK